MPLPSPDSSLEHFVNAQQATYSNAISELVAGKKLSHWMWYIFPQLKGLGYSEMAHKYAISGTSQALLYLKHPVLGARYMDCCQALVPHTNKTAYEIFSTPDDLKLHSSLTLFHLSAPKVEIFTLLLNQFFDGQNDSKTLNYLNHK